MRTTFPIVGVGASAGGLEAFTQLLKHLPPNTGMAFVLVQHLDPHHESALAQLLKRATSMPVREVTDNLRVQANHVYVIPPNKNLRITKGVLKLQPRRQNGGGQRSIDSFLESLSQDQGERAIGVILSGTASDGTVGLEAIKAEGGITFAQDESAKYASMPRSASAAGCVDFVLSPENIAGELAHIAKHPFATGQPIESRSGDERKSSAANGETTLPRRGRGPPRPSRLSTKESGSSSDSSFKNILVLLRNHSGVDFTLYRPNTIQRRITRRMVLNKMTSLGEYAAFLRGNAKELEALYSDVLIHVTSFFRNPEAFDLLKRKVFPKLAKDRTNDAVRIWVLGCSTGQEAYSLAMALQEYFKDATRAPKFQIFATDLKTDVLDKARAGFYAKTMMAGVSPERLRRFFVEEQDGYRVIKTLRETIVFAPQNLLRDPPFSRMDLISCRNLLIYLDPSLQKKAVPTFHYALKPAGFLFLGAAESISGYSDLFEPVDKKLKIYSRRPGPTPVQKLEFGPKDSASKKDPPERVPQATAERPPTELNMEREADRVAARRHAPPSVLVNAALQVLQFRGETGRYLKSPTGRPTVEVLKMAREGLLGPMRAALNTAKKENKAVRKANVRVVENGQSRRVNLEVVPLTNLKERCLLIFFDEAAEGEGARLPTPSHVPGRPGTGAKESRQATELKRELAEKDDYLQSIQEQYETAQEELQASNEEVTSTNEELQSLNEELETSKEELESTNEELTTINDEMVNRNSELSRLNSDLHNLHTSVNLAIVVFARDLTIRRFTPMAEKVFNLLATDVGRPISAVRHNLDFPGLEDLLKEVIDTVTKRERETRDKAGRWYALRARPYLSLDNKVDGAVLVLVDIDELKRTEERVRRARDYAEATIRTARDPLVILRADLTVETANDAFYKAFKVTAQETEDVRIYKLSHGQWSIPKLRELLEEIVPRNSYFNDFEVTHDFEHIGRRTMLLNARRIDNPSGTPEKILLGIEDITERVRIDEEIRRSEDRFRSLVLASAQVVWTTNAEGLVEQDSPTWRAFTGQTLEQWKGWGWLDAIHPDDREATRKIWSESVSNKRVCETQYRLCAKDGTYHWTAVRIVPVLKADGSIREWIGMSVDITERRKREEALRESEERYRTLFNLGPIAVYSIDNLGVIQNFNRRAAELWGREPQLGDTDERFCGSFKMFRPDGSFMPHEQCPMAEVVSGKLEVANDAEVLMERPDGSRVTVIVNIRPLKNERGQITGVINCFYDVTDRKREEEARAQLASIVESSDDAIISKDLNGIITSWNKGAQKLFGYTAQEAIGQSVTMLIPPDRFDEEPVILARIRRGEAIEHYETVRHRKDGSLIDISLTVSPIRNDQGKVVGASKIARDVTDRKNAEQALRESQALLASRAAQLEQLVVERTAKLQETIGELEHFSYTITHDMRAPLRAMQGFSAMLLSEAKGLTPKSADYLRRIMGASYRMDALIQDSLQYAKVIRERIPLKPIEPGPVLRGILESYPNLQPPLAEIELVEPFPPICASEAGLGQCFSNLLSNAIKFVTPDKVPRVRVWAEARGDLVRFWFEDNGIGIPAEHQERIFGMFQQLDKSYEGTGVGLALVRKTAERLDGKVGVESEAGKGSRFWLEFKKAGNPATHQSCD